MTREELFRQFEPLAQEMTEKYEFRLQQKENEIVQLKWEVESLKKYADQIWKLAVDRIAEEMLKTKMATKEIE